MKITKARLNQLIQEEYERMLNEGLGDWLTGAASGVGRLGRNLANTIYDATARPDIPSTRVGPAANVSRMQTPEERTAEREDARDQIDAGTAVGDLAGMLVTGGASSIPTMIGRQLGSSIKGQALDPDNLVAAEKAISDARSAYHGGQGQPTPQERTQQQQQLAMNSPRSPRSPRRPRRGMSK